MGSLPDIPQGYIRDGKFYDSKNERVNKGKGRFYGQNGHIFEGSIIDGKRSSHHINAREGRQVDDVGTYYGNWSDDMKNGQGKMSYKNGETYDGKWKKNKRHGKGFLSHPNMSEPLLTFWLNDIQQTFVQQLENGYKIEYPKVGEKEYYFEFGQMKSPDGSVYYEGGFKNHIMHGKGTLYEKDKTRHDGMWENGFKHGIVTITYPDGSIPFAQKWVFGKTLSRKVILLGDDSVGKSSLINSYLNNECTKQIPPTVSIVHHSKQVNLDDQEIHLEIFDTCGSSDYTNSQWFLKSADIILFVFDINRQKQSLSSLRKYIDLAEEICNSKVVKLLVGHKCDSPNPQELEQNDAISETGLECFFTSQLNNSSIQTLFNQAIAQSFQDK